MRPPRPSPSYFAGATLILLAAVFLRVWALGDTDIGLHYDEAAMLLLSRGIASGQSLPTFIRAFTGHEVGLHYIAAFFLRFGSDSVFGMRLAAAFVGVVTVAGTMAAARALFAAWPRANWVALFAGAGMAALFPHVLLSRYGFRAISQPMFEVLAIAALWIGLRSRRRRWLIAGGALVGLTGYTYLAARLFPLPLALALAWWLIRARNGRALLHLTVIAASAALVFAPLGLFFLNNPDTFSVRIGQVAAPTLGDAAGGMLKVLAAFGLPGRGDPYVRFNLPGEPILDPLSAALALAGLIALLVWRAKDAAGSSARVLVLAGLFFMSLASALATSEITPSNLRLIGAYPFLVMLPALGAVALLARLPRLPAAFPIAFIGLLAISVIGARTNYVRWAARDDLFTENHGEMAMAARALDALAGPGRTVYIASEHYQHPTVAALAKNYTAAKWLTGGATIVLPASGEAVYLIPRDLRPPAPWPDLLTSRWTTEEQRSASGGAALIIHRLSAGAVADIRAALVTQPAADFGHVVRAWDARALTACEAGARCPVLVAWEIMASYPQLQLAARAFHPLTGEWGRANPFHYPPGEWTVGEIALDQIEVPVAPGAPPIDGYRVGVSFFNPETRDILPRLDDAGRFAGIEADFALGRIQRPATTPQTPQSACREDARPVAGGGSSDLTLLAIAPLNKQARPGERLGLELCWLATLKTAGLAGAPMTIALTGQGSSYSLYAMPPVSATFPFDDWQAGQVIRDRYALRVPRDAAPGRYTLAARAGGQTAIPLGEIDVTGLQREFAEPAVTRLAAASFGDRIGLLGFDAEGGRRGQSMRVTLYWRALGLMDDDYVAYVHVIDPASGRLIAQSDAMPRNGEYPTSLWAVNEIVSDTRVINLPAGIAPGEYALQAGFYLLPRGEHLQFQGKDSAPLGVIRIE